MAGKRIVDTAETTGARGISRRTFAKGALGALLGVTCFTWLPGGMFAYFFEEAAKTRENKEPLRIEVEVVEPHWTAKGAGESVNVVANQSVAKDPYIINRSEDKPGWLFAEVRVPRASVVVADGEGFHGARAVEQDLFEFIDPATRGWIVTDMPFVQMSDDSVPETIYRWAWPVKVQPGDETPILFDEVTVANLIDGQGQAGIKSVVVSAYGVDASEIDDPRKAWEDFKDAEDIPGDPEIYIVYHNPDGTIMRGKTILYKTGVLATDNIPSTAYLGWNTDPAKAADGIVRYRVYQKDENGRYLLNPDAITTDSDVIIDENGEYQDIHLYPVFRKAVIEFITYAGDNNPDTVVISQATSTSSYIKSKRTGANITKGFGFPRTGADYYPYVYLRPGTDLNLIIGKHIEYTGSSSWLKPTYRPDIPFEFTADSIVDSLELMVPNESISGTPYNKWSIITVGEPYVNEAPEAYVIMGSIDDLTKYYKLGQEPERNDYVFKSWSVPKLLDEEGTDAWIDENDVAHYRTYAQWEYIEKHTVIYAGVYENQVTHDKFLVLTNKKYRSGDFRIVDFTYNNVNGQGAKPLNYWYADNDDNCFRDKNGNIYVPWEDYKSEIKYVCIVDEIAPKNCAHWFSGMTGLDSSWVRATRRNNNGEIADSSLSNTYYVKGFNHNNNDNQLTDDWNGLVWLDLSQCTDVSYMFADSNLSNIAIPSSWDLSKIGSTIGFLDGNDGVVKH